MYAKLHTLRRVKKDLHMELYLDTYNGQQRRTLAMFRMGVVPLKMEKERWLENAIEERTCSFCTQHVEDELHLSRCLKYNGLFKISIMVGVKHTPLFKHLYKF